MSAKNNLTGDQSAATSSPSPRPIRSYVIRGGRLTTSQSKAINAYWQHYVIEYDSEALDFNSLFANSNNVILEIGFGMGDSLLEMAQLDPSSNYVGVEVHMPGVGKLLQGIANANLTNLKIINHDAKDVLANSIADNSLAKIQIFFPDPWHKKKHHKRRLIQDDFVTLLAGKLEQGGELHLATDWEPYAEQMLTVLDNCTLLENIAGKGGFSDAGSRPATKFEKRGKKLGHGVWDLRYVKS